MKANLHGFYSSLLVLFHETIVFTVNQNGAELRLEMTGKLERAVVTAPDIPITMPNKADSFHRTFAVAQTPILSLLHAKAGRHRRGWLATA